MFQSLLLWFLDRLDPCSEVSSLVLDLDARSTFSGSSWLRRESTLLFWLRPARWSIAPLLSCQKVHLHCIIYLQILNQKSNESTMIILLTLWPGSIFSGLKKTRRASKCWGGPFVWVCLFRWVVWPYPTRPSIACLLSLQLLKLLIIC